MWRSFKEYFYEVCKLWWIVAIGFLAGIAGLVLDILTQITFPTWIWITLGLVGLLIAQFLAFHNVRFARDSLQEKVQQAALAVSSPKQPKPVLVISILDYQFGTASETGFPQIIKDALWLRFHAILNPPLGAMLVESLELSLIGKRIMALDWKAMPIGGPIGQYFYFEIPTRINVGEHTIRLIAFANGEEWCSNELNINFPTDGKSKDV